MAKLLCLFLGLLTVSFFTACGHQNGSSPSNLGNNEFLFSTANLESISYERRPLGLTGISAFENFKIEGIDSPSPTITIRLPQAVVANMPPSCLKRKVLTNHELSQILGLLNGLPIVYGKDTMQPVPLEETNDLKVTRSGISESYFLKTPIGSQFKYFKDSKNTTDILVGIYEKYLNDPSAEKICEDKN